MEFFYLKICRNDVPAYRYLRQWFDVFAKFPEVKIYMICENEKLQKHLHTWFNFCGLDHDFINIEEELPVKHAESIGCKNFYAIDADNIGLYAKSEKIFELLKTVKDYADKNKIDLFTMDSTKFAENFGVSYVSNIEIKNTKSFYVENLYYIRHHENIYKNPKYGLSYCSEGKKYFPTLQNAFGIDKTALIKDEVIKIDIGLTADESLARLIYVTELCDPYMKIIENPADNNCRPWVRDIKQSNFANDCIRLADFTGKVIKWKSSI